VMPKIETHWIEKYGQVAATGKPIEFENYSQELGRYFHVMSFRPAPKQFACIFQDITERKQSENTLRKSEKKFRSMMDSFTDPLYICSSEFKIEYMNPAMTRRIGRNATGEPCYGALHGLDRKCDWCVFDKVGSGEIIEVNIKSPLDDRNYHVTNMPIYNPDGTISKMTIFRDITDYLKALSEKEQAQEQIRQAHKMKAIGTLTGGIAHEFNNMLGIIIGNVELAADDIAEDNPAADYIEEIRIASLRARDVVQKLMIAAQKNPTQRKPIQISAVVKDSLDLLRKTIPADIDIRPKIACTSERILADQSEIHQVMINLCTNSAHAVKNESGVLEVLLETVTLDERFAARFKDLLPGDYVRLTVRDNGEGIAPGDMDRIFDPYFTTKDIDEGLGMGLAVVHGIVKKNNGAIHIESNVGKGTTVEVLFPLLETLSKEEVEQSETLPTGTERILFIDDEASLVKMVKQMLERSGYEVVGKTSSTDAVKVFTENPGRFDLVISDISMPDMPGDRLAQKMIQIRPDIPIIVCTGHSDRIDEKKAQDMGIQAFIMKPLTKADLTKTVRKVLDGKN
jgi:signal transduction histidine kinase/ActR/RegA family two-component response regulator